MVRTEGSLAPPQTLALVKVRDGESGKSPPRWHRRTRALAELTPLPVQAPAVAGIMFSGKTVKIFSALSPRAQDKSRKHLILSVCPTARRRWAEGGGHHKIGSLRNRHGVRPTPRFTAALLEIPAEVTGDVGVFSEWPNHAVRAATRDPSWGASAISWGGRSFMLSSKAGFYAGTAADVSFEESPRRFGPVWWMRGHPFLSKSPFVRFIPPRRFFLFLFGGQLRPILSPGSEQSR